MKKLFMFAAPAIIAASAAYFILTPIVSSPAYAAGWQCTASGLKNARYSGSGKAYIHLRGYGRGDKYSVKKEGKCRVGYTGDGTKFTCCPK